MGVAVGGPCLDYYSITEFRIWLSLSGGNDFEISGEAHLVRGLQRPCPVLAPARNVHLAPLRGHGDGLGDVEVFEDGGEGGSLLVGCRHVTKDERRGSVLR